MPYWIAGIDVHKKMLAVVVADVEVDGDFHFERQKVGTTPSELRHLATGWSSTTSSKSSWSRPRSTGGRCGTRSNSTGAPTAAPALARRRSRARSISPKPNRIVAPGAQERLPRCGAAREAPVMRRKYQVTRIRTIAQILSQSDWSSAV